MTSTGPSLEDRIKSITAVVSAITGFLAVLPGLSKNCREGVEEATKLNLSPWVWLLIALVLLVSGALLSLDKILQSLDKICTFPENTELAAIGQGVVSADFSAPTGERPSRARRGSPT